MAEPASAPQPPIFNLQAYSPAEIKQAVEKIGVKKANFPFLTSVMLAIVAGVGVGFGALYYTIVASDPTWSFASVRVVGGLVFTVGALVLVGGAELFTGSNLIVMARASGKVRLIPAVKAKLLEGKKGLVVGIANERSIAWGCAAAFRAFGADLAITYLDDKAKKHVNPLARALESPIVMPLDARVPGQMEDVFERISSEWGKLDFVVHSIAFAPQKALHGRVIDVPLEGFLTTMQISCWTFLRMAALAEPLMKKGGTLFTMTYYGSQTVVKNYNIMGVAKAALESAVRYVSAELGPKGIRVHAISPGPLATRAASGIPEFDKLLEKAKAKAPARSLVTIEDVGAATAFLAHDAARLITGDTIYIDGGYHVVD